MEMAANPAPGTLSRDCGKMAQSARVRFDMQRIEHRFDMDIVRGLQHRRIATRPHRAASAVRNSPARRSAHQPVVIPARTLEHVAALGHAAQKPGVEVLRQVALSSATVT